MLLLSKNDFLYLVGFICISIVIILFLSKKFQLFDHPDKIRKLHAKPVFFTGGILVATNMLFAIKLFNFEYSLEVIFIHSLYFLIIGFFDDLCHLKPQTKLITIFIFILIYFFSHLDGGIKLIDSIGPLDIFGYIGFGKLTIIINTLALLFILNANNFIDGIDGYCSTLNISVISIILIFANFFGFLNFELITLLFIYIIILTVFSIFNINKKYKLFLGNNGSLYLGFVLHGICAYLIYHGISVFLIMWCLAIIIYDAFATLIVRRLNSINFNSIFNGRNDHLHHLLEKKFGYLRSMIIAHSINIFLSIYGFISFYFLPPFMNIINYILVFVIFIKIKIFFYEKIYK